VQIEIDQQACWPAGELQIRNDLREMDRMEVFDSFDLHDDRVLHEKIELQASVSVAFASCKAVGAVFSAPRDRL
jgi:hypothetical protein